MSPSAHDPTVHRIRRKPPPTLDISDRYPSPDPSDPFAPLWVLRNRTPSGVSSQDIPQYIVNRNSSLCSTTADQVSVNTSISPTRTPSPKAKLAHYRPYSQAFIDSSPGFPLISSPLAASQPDLFHRQHPSPESRRTTARSAREFFDLNDGSSGTESDSPSVSSHRKTTFIRPRHSSTSKRTFPKFLLLKNASFLGSGKAATGKRPSTIEIQKSTVSPPVVSTVTWTPDPISSDSINGQSTSKFTASLSADLLDSLTLTSDENIHQHQHHKRHPTFPDVRKDLKQLQFPKLPSVVSIPPKMLKKKISSHGPLSSTIAHRKRSTSSSSYVYISMPTPVPAFLHPSSEDAYTSPRKAPVPPPPVNAQEEAPKECPDRSCRYKCIHSISSEWGLPSLLQLNYAASLPITGDDGKQITFGSLFESQRTIVVFIRHFWCPLCQDYISSVKSFVRPEMVCNTCERGHKNQLGIHHDQDGTADLDTGTRVQFVVISNGAHGMIAKYKQIFELPFKVYTDPSLALYQALGLGNLKDSDVKYHNHQTHGRATSQSGMMASDISKQGGYVKHSLMGGIAMVVMRALKVCMPVWEKGGDIDQLGGEFIFGPGLTCTYAHRMQTTKGHAPIQDVLRAAGISAPNDNLSNTEDHTTQPEPTATGRSTHPSSRQEPRRRHESMKTLGNKETSQVTTATRPELSTYSIGMMSLEDEDRWMEYRHDSIERLRARKDMRRGINRAGSSQSNWSRQPLEMTEETTEIARLKVGDSGEHPLPTPIPLNRRYSMNY